MIQNKLTWENEFINVLFTIVSMILTQFNTIKVITVHQPWAWAIAYGFKDVENRTWSTKYRGSLVIHSAKSRKSLKPHLDFVKTTTKINDPKLDFGCLIAIVDLVDCVENHPSIWAMDGHYHFVLENPRLIHPLEKKGQLGLWNIDDIWSDNHA